MLLKSHLSASTLFSLMFCCFGTFFPFSDFLVFTTNSRAPALTWPFDDYTGNIKPTGLFSRAANCREGVVIVIRTHLFEEHCDMEERGRGYVYEVCVGYMWFF